MGLRLDHFEVLDKIPKPGTISDRHRHLRSKVPVGKSGPWAVERFEVERGLSLLRSMRDGRGTVPGNYTRLIHASRGIVMTDTDAELDDMEKFLDRARGRVLIHGLGLGCALAGVLQKKSVTSVDVVEIDNDVMKLVSPHFVDDRVAFYRADCRRKPWPKSAKWDVVWHDIWDEICGDNEDAIRELRERFCGRCKWQACWCEELI